VKKQYSATIGTPDELKNIDTEADRDVLVEGRDVYEAHKNAMNKCRSVEEVITIKENGKVVYSLAKGFNPSE